MEPVQVAFEKNRNPSTGVLTSETSESAPTGTAAFPTRASTVARKQVPGDVGAAGAEVMNTSELGGVVSVSVWVMGISRGENDGVTVSTVVPALGRNEWK